MGYDPLFLKWSQKFHCLPFQIQAQKPWSVVFPSVPMVRVSRLLAILQLLRMPFFLNVASIASLVMTNANRICLAAGRSETILEFGVHRARENG